MVKMGGKWVQAENKADEKLDVYVWVEDAPVIGSLEIGSDSDAPTLLGPDGKPLSSIKPKRRRVGFLPPDAR